MIPRFVARFQSAEGQAALRTTFAAAHPLEYRALVEAVVTILAGDDDETPDKARVHEINDGDYQGTLVYVIGAYGYQPSTYWYVKVSYGSCSGCDTLQAIHKYTDAPPTPGQIDEYMLLALHIVQGLKRMGGED